MKQLLPLLIAATAPAPLPLIKDGDLLRIPHPEVICRHRELAAYNLQRMQERRSVDPREQVTVAVEQCKFHFAIWDTLSSASGNQGEARINALNGLRHLMGPVAYYRGDTPPMNASFWFPDDSVHHVKGPLR